MKAASVTPLTMLVLLAACSGSARDAAPVPGAAPPAADASPSPTASASVAASAPLPASATSAMIDPPQIVSAPARHTAVIRLEVPRAEMQQVMGPAIGELFATLGSAGVTPAGPLFARHFRLDPQVFDFEVGVPVDAPVEPVGRVVPGELPATRVVRAVYRGPYEQLGAAWGELDAWIAGRPELRPAEWLWEVYVAGPESSDDPAEWRTELNRPLRE